MRALLIAIIFIAAPIGVPVAYALGSSDMGTVTSGPTQDLGTVTTYGQAPAAQGAPVFLENPLKGVDCTRGNGKCLESFLLNILDFVIRIGAIVVVLMVVLVGFKFVTAQGEPGKLSEARVMLLWTVVGALILLGAEAIALGIQATVTALGG